jgi:hypothetical protein
MQHWDSKLELSTSSKRPNIQRCRNSRTIHGRMCFNKNRLLEGPQKPKFPKKVLTNYLAESLTTAARTLPLLRALALERNRKRDTMCQD